MSAEKPLDLSCPFCGGPAKIMELVQIVGKPKEYSVACQNCSLSYPIAKLSEKFAAAGWNTRAPQAPAVPPQETYLEALRALDLALYPHKERLFQAMRKWVGKRTPNELIALIEANMDPAGSAVASPERSAQRRATLSNMLMNEFRVTRSRADELAKWFEEKIKEDEE